VLICVFSRQTQIYIDTDADITTDAETTIDTDTRLVRGKTHIRTCDVAFNYFHKLSIIA